MSTIRQSASSNFDLWAALIRSVVRAINGDGITSTQKQSNLPIAGSLNRQISRWSGSLPHTSCRRRPARDCWVLVRMTLWPHRARERRKTGKPLALLCPWCHCPAGVVGAAGAGFAAWAGLSCPAAAEGGGARLVSTAMPNSFHSSPTSWKSKSKLTCSGCVGKKPVMRSMPLASISGLRSNLGWNNRIGDRSRPRWRRLVNASASRAELLAVWKPGAPISRKTV